MSHDHSHPHPQPGQHNKAFAIGIALNVAFVIVEVVYGFLADSSALLADAGHNASDVLSLAFAWTAAWLATKSPTGKYTYGFRRTTILVSILNALLLFVAVGLITGEAIHKLFEPEAVNASTVMWVAAVGIVVNTFTALLFVRGQKEDLNVKGAFLHMAADAAVSLGVVVAGYLIQLTGYNWIDPVISFVIVLVILWSTVKVFIESVNLALDAVPENIDLEEVREFLLSIEGVEDVHDLHIWAMSTTQTALTTHLVVPEGYSDAFMQEIRTQLYQKFKIEHTTIQIEKYFHKDHHHQDCC